MTEFEMAYLLTDMQSAVANLGAMQLTLVSGFLVASYVAAHRVSVVLMAIALPIYTFSYFSNAFLLSRLMYSLGGLVLHMHDVAGAGKELQWHAAADGLAPAWYFELAPYASWAWVFLVYGGTLAFFFHCRRLNRKAESGSWKPRFDS